MSVCYLVTFTTNQTLMVMIHKNTFQVIITPPVYISFGNLLNLLMIYYNRYNGGKDYNIHLLIAI